MRILSFDIGIKNLAYCLLDVQPEDNFIIQDWSVKDISDTASKKYDLHQTIKTLLDCLEEIIQNSSTPIDVVLIENQPVLKNPIMKTLQIIIFTFFHMKKRQHQLPHSIDFVSANSKNKAYKLLPQDKGEELCNASIEKAKTDKGYKYNKVLAVHVCHEILSRSSIAPDIIEMFQKHKKKDDLADCFLQAYTNFYGKCKK